MATTVRDNTGILHSEDIQTARAKAYPFDARVLIATTSSRDALDDLAHEQVTGPNVVALVIDLVHHMTSVRFGGGVALVRVGTAGPAVTTLAAHRRVGIVAQVVAGSTLVAAEGIGNAP